MARLSADDGQIEMKLASCILAFSDGIARSNRPEDRSVVSQYLAALAPLLAKVTLEEKSGTMVSDIDRLFGQTWVIDSAPFEEAFRLWRVWKAEIAEGDSE